MKTILQTRCAYCGKIAREKSRFSISPSSAWVSLECGHTITQSLIVVKDDIDIESSDGRTLFDFQKKTVKFIEAANCNGMILHEQGLGKTVIAAAVIARSVSLQPALVICPAGLRLQWFHELYRWSGIAAQVITSSKEMPYLDDFPVVIVSIDTLRLLRPDVKTVSDEQIAIHEALGHKKPLKAKQIRWTDEICAKFKLIIVDESQKIKNPGSSRTQALRLIAGAAQRLAVAESKTDDGKASPLRVAMTGEKTKIICMSGTNIEKHAGEYFVTLNLVRPELFSSQSMFQIQHCQINSLTGKIMGLRHPDYFKELTRDFIIRYKREEVLPDLPKVFRQFRLAEMPEDETKAYIKLVKEFQEKMDEAEEQGLHVSPTDILGYLTRMRHITGVAKVNAALEFVEEFLLESERKLVIFRHHKQADAILLAMLENLCKYGTARPEPGAKVLNLYNPPLRLGADMTLEQRHEMIEQFKRPENRIAVMSTQAGGVGLNLQFVSDCLIMERQWNPAQEEQAEGRFPRPGSTADKINAHYLIAAGTIDDFLTTIVEEKRRNVAQTLDGQDIIWDEKSLVGELTKVLQTKGLKKWKL